MDKHIFDAEREIDGHRFNPSAAMGAVLGLVVATASMAYAVPANAADPSDPQATSKDDGLNEIVVTANRRSENIQKVPIAVTAISSSAMDEFSIKRPEDLAKVVPGLAAIPNAGTAVTAFSIRGIGQADAAPHEEQPVAVYQDGVYIANSAATGFPIYDVQRAEVLRGPQGTLFGRNATGGLIQFISNQPTAGPSGLVEASLGDYNLHRVLAVVNDGSDELAGRLAVYVSQRRGYTKNLMGPDLASEDIWAGRGQVAAKLGEDTNLTLRLEAWRTHGNNDPGMSTPAYYTPDGYPHLIPANVDIYGTGPGKDFYGYRAPQQPFLREVNDTGAIYKKVETIAPTLSHVMGDYTLYSISSYSKYDILYREDTDNGKLYQTGYTDGADSREYTEELRIQKTSGRFRLTAGAFYFDVDGNYNIGYNLPTFCDPDSPTSCSIDRSPANLPLVDTVLRGARSSVDYSLHTKSTALFTQGEYDLTDKLTAVLGGRYTFDRQNYTYLFNCYETIASGCSTIFGVGTPGVVSGLGLLRMHQGYDDWSGKAGLNYKVTDNIMAYTSVSKGLKSAGYSVAPDGFVLPSQLPFKPEKLYAYEGGLKTSFFDRKFTVNLAGYVYDYKNSQQFSFSGVSFSIINKDAYAKGGELELIARPMAGLTINGSLGYNDLWVKDINTPRVPTGEDQRGINAPVWVANWGASKTFALPASRTLTLAYNGRYTGSRYFGIVNTEVDYGAPYTTHDLAVTLEATGGLSVSVVGSNIANKVYFTETFDQTFNGYRIAHIAPPRMLLVQVDYKF
jgi:iron complex outermembrane recepter protein